MNPLLATCLQSIVVTTSDPTGYERVQVEVRPGDVLEYLRNGYAGGRRGVLVAIHEGKNPLEIAPVGPDGVAIPGARRIRRSIWGVVHAWRAGVLLGVPEPFDGEVVSFEPPVAGGSMGWVEVRRRDAIGHSIAFNACAEGWPSRGLVAGEVVRCAMRQVADGRWAWFIEA